MRVMASRMPVPPFAFIARMGRIMTSPPKALCLSHRRQSVFKVSKELACQGRWSCAHRD